MLDLYLYVNKITQETKWKTKRKCGCLLGAISGISTLSDGEIVDDSSVFADDTAALHAELTGGCPT